MRHLGIRHQLIEVRLVVLRPVHGRPVQRIPDLHLSYVRNDSFDKLVVNGRFHEHASGGDAVLAFVEEDGLAGLPNGAVEVGVGEDDQRGLAAELERNLRAKGYQNQRLYNVVLSGVEGSKACRKARSKSASAKTMSGLAAELE